ncbi:MAG: sigma-70 family RNA polymerase sigma factor [Myxococcales bacterium]|nr:sigma-70 family RNA polymerase sigma factor [Myxococcales bacterium]
MSSHEETSDTALLQAWRAGDLHAANDLLRRHFGRIFRYFDRHVSGPEAEDLTQRTFEACVTTRDRLRDDASFRAYLLGIARKQLLRHFEYKRPRGTELPPSQLDLQDIRTSPSGVMVRHDQQRLFLDALAPLPAEYREVLELFFWQDRTMPEIAEQLGVPLGTVKSRLHRGKALLRSRIEALPVTSELRRSTLDELDSRALDGAPAVR